jgi:hypothetical protein
MIMGMPIGDASHAADNGPAFEPCREDGSTPAFVDRSSAPGSTPVVPDRAHLHAVGAAPQLGQGPVLGRVTKVEAGQVVVTLSDDEAVQRAEISALVALPAANGFLLGIIDALECEGGSDLVTAKLMPVGAFHPSPEGGSFRVGAAHQPRIHADCHLVEGAIMTHLMACIAGDVAPEERLVLGRYGGSDGPEAVANGNRLFQRHLAILGNSGAGKSWAVAMLLERAARLRNASLIVLDLHGEYGPLSDGGLATRLRLGGPADYDEQRDDLIYIPYWLFQLDELAMILLNGDDPHAADQRLWLTQRIETLKRGAVAASGEYEMAQRVTVDSPIPYRVEDVLRGAERDDVANIVLQPSGKVVPGPYTGKLRSLINRIEACFADPRYTFIFRPPAECLNSNWLPMMALMLLDSGSGTPGIKTIDLSELPTSLVPLVAGLVARLTYDIQFWTESSKRTPVCIVCDEAHVYLRETAEHSPIYDWAMLRFETIAKEGRKYGVCLAVVSQRPSELNRTVLSQCNNFMILRLSNDPDHEAIVQLVPGAFAGVADLLPTLDVGEAVVVGDAVPVPARIKLDRATNGPDSRTIPYWSLWANQPSSTQAIVKGASALRAQSRALASEATFGPDPGAD